MYWCYRYLFVPNIRGLDFATKVLCRVMRCVSFNLRAAPRHPLLLGHFRSGDQAASHAGRTFDPHLYSSGSQFWDSGALRHHITDFQRW